MPPHVVELIERGVRCVVLFARNFASRAQVAALCAELHTMVADSHDPDLLICVDHEGGRVQRFREGFTEVPAARSIGAHVGGPKAAIAEAARWGEIVGGELRAIGIDLNFAPVVDVDTNPVNPVIGERSFGGDPELVSACAAAFIKAMQARGVAACAKHFPGHGDTVLDSHLALPRLPHAMERLERIELPPFRAAIDAGVASIMTAHVLFEAIDPRTPSTLSPLIVEGLLRRRMGFDGLVFSDDLEMKAVADPGGVGLAAVRAIAAGCDIALVCADPEHQLEAESALAEAIGSGQIDRRRVTDSARRRAMAARVRG